MHIRRAALAALMLLSLCPLPLREGRGWLLMACVPDQETPFAQRPAFFRFSPVTAAPKTLLPALNGVGEWCTITKQPNAYRFVSLTTHLEDTYPLTQLDAYGTPTWVSGLIVGTPTSPDMNGFFGPVVYDLVCPNCFEEGITRPISVSDVSLARALCSRCHTSYDLNNGGIVIESPETQPRRLFRYRCRYDNDVFVVQN